MWFVFSQISNLQNPKKKKTEKKDQSYTNEPLILELKLTQKEERFTNLTGTLSSLEMAET
jgi:hypothetical protein